MEKHTIDMEKHTIEISRENEDITIKAMEGMFLHEEIVLTRYSGQTEILITKVVGGWIYEVHIDVGVRTSVFVRQI